MLVPTNPIGPPWRNLAYPLHRPSNPHRCPRRRLSFFGHKGCKLLALLFWSGIQFLVLVAVSEKSDKGTGTHGERERGKGNSALIKQLVTVPPHVFKGPICLVALESSRQKQVDVVVWVACVPPMRLLGLTPQLTLNMDHRGGSKALPSLGFVRHSPRGEETRETLRGFCNPSGSREVSA